MYAYVLFLFCNLLKVNFIKKVSMIRKYHRHTLQTSPPRERAMGHRQASWFDKPSDWICILEAVPDKLDIKSRESGIPYFRLCLVTIVVLKLLHVFPRHRKEMCCFNHLLHLNIFNKHTWWYIALVRRPPCELNISCTSTTAESRAKIWYQ